MASTPGFADHCSELLAAAGPVRIRRMFGGHGLYIDDLFVGIIAGDALYLKADAQSRGAFEAAGGQRFGDLRQGRAAGLDFWTVPAEAMDSPALMRPWARMAMEAALRARVPAKRRKA